jgi:hypothetical protein
MIVTTARRRGPRRGRGVLRRRRSALDFTRIIPSREAWDAGDRTILCALWQCNLDPMVGSARGTDR